MKKKFNLWDGSTLSKTTGSIEIIGQDPKDIPYISVTIEGTTLFVRDQDMERLAVNILKALNKKA